MDIINKPSDLNLSGNLEKFKISSPEKITFLLKLGNEHLLQQTYDPSPSGFIEIDVKDVVESRLTCIFRDSTEVYIQSDLARTFVAEINGVAHTFKVIRSGVDQLQDPADNFLRFNFLTWQPQTKKVTYYQPEYLTYYAVENVKVKLRAYFQTFNGDTEFSVIDYAALEAGNVYTLPMQYGLIAGKFSNRLPGFYDVWIENEAGARLTFIQRYVASDILSEQEQWILFGNSLGGIDTFRAYGTTDFSGEHKHNIAEIGDVSFDYRIDTERKFKKNTGYLDNYERQWLLDFFPASEKFIYAGSTTRRIVVLEDEAGYNARELPSSYTFTYKYADARPLLNLPRSESLPEVLEITLPDLASFTIPPRLIEFPHLPLSEGVMLPAQNPFSENWGIVTAGGLANFLRDRFAALDGGTGGVGHTHTNFDLLQLLRYVNEYLLINDKKIKAGLADRATVADELKSENFSSGAFGSGMRFYMKNGVSYGEIDQLLVRMKAIFHELVIEKLSHVGGQVILSPARLTCTKVEELESSFRCYFKTTDGDKTVTNDFVVGDQARCQTFNIKAGVHQNVSNRFYWRLVIGIGEDYIDLSKADCAEGSDTPEAGDDIVQLGNRNIAHEDRQHAILLSAYGTDAPCLKQYMYIDSYSLEGKECQIISPNGNRYAGDFLLKTGLDIATQLQVLENLIKTEIQSVEYIINNEDNYLTNASFTADIDNWVTDANLSLYEDNSGMLTVNQAFYSGNEIFVGLATYNGKYMLRIRNSYIKQLNKDIKDITQTAVFYISFKYICREAGTLTCGFADQRLYKTTQLAFTRTPKLFQLFGVWDGTGDFIIQFTGDIYISLVTLTNKPLEDFKEETRSNFEQTDKRITTEVSKINKTLESYSTIEQTAESIKSEVSAFYQGIENLVQRSECYTDKPQNWPGNPYIKGCPQLTVSDSIQIGLMKAPLDTSFYLSFSYINSTPSSYISLSGDTDVDYKCLTLSFDYFITSLFPRTAKLSTGFGVYVDENEVGYGTMVKKQLTPLMGRWVHASISLDYRENTTHRIAKVILLENDAENATILVRNISLREVDCDLPYSPSTLDIATKSIVEQTASNWSAKILNGQDNIIAAINMDRSGTHMIGVVSFDSFTADFKEAYEQAFGNASMTAKDDIARHLGFSNYAGLVEQAATQGKAILIGGYLNLDLIDVKTLLAGTVLSELIKSNGININDRFIISPDSKNIKIGNLSVTNQGALMGGNAIFDNVEQFMFINPTLTEVDLENFIIDRIAKMTTIIFSIEINSYFTPDKLYTVYLPDLLDLQERGISECGFKLTIIAPGKIFRLMSMELNIRYSIRCRPDNRLDPIEGMNPPPDSRTYIRDNNYGIINHIDMDKGDVLEFYYYAGDYYLLNQRT